MIFLRSQYMYMSYIIFTLATIFVCQAPPTWVRNIKLGPTIDVFTKLLDCAVKLAVFSSKKYMYM